MPNRPPERLGTPVARAMVRYATFTKDGFCKPIVRRYGAWALNIAIKGHMGTLPNRHATDFSIVSRWISGDLVTKYTDTNEHVGFDELAEADQVLLFDLALDRLRQVRKHDNMPNPAPYSDARTTGAVAQRYETPEPQTEEANDADQYAWLDEPIDVGAPAPV